MPPEDKSAANELRRFALAKMANILGPERARQLLDRLLGELGIELATPQELMMLSERMTKLGGFEAAIGAMLGVAAVLRGATPTHQEGGERVSSTGSPRPSFGPS